MKLYMIFIVLFINFNAPSQDIKGIIGSWLYIGMNNKKQMTECPDILIFKEDGTYSIQNECYGDNYEDPFIEKGKWVIDPFNKKIILQNRNFYTNYAFHNFRTTLTLYLNGVTDKFLNICFDKTKYKTENYEKIK